MTFPDNTLKLRVEMAFGADLSASPTTWPWVDVTDRVEEQAIRHIRGQPSEAGAVQPSQLSFRLNNLDGELTPTNEASAWFPNMRRGTPVRVWVEGAAPALVLDGSAGSVCSTPDHDDFDFADDFDIRVRAQPDAWVDVSYDIADASATSIQCFVAKATDATTEASWSMESRADGRAALRLSTSGTSLGGPTLKEGRLGGLGPRWFGVAADPTNASASTWTAYTWDEPGDPPADITDWVHAGETDQVGTFGAVHAGTGPVRIGGLSATPYLPLRGVVEKVEIRDGVNGTVVGDPDFAAADPGDTEVTDSTGKVWTLGAGAEISTDRVRFVGTVDDLALTWPLGDNHVSGGSDPTECYVEMTCAGPLRRLQQGQTPLRSSIYRTVTRNDAGGLAQLFQYWPCEDLDRTVRAPSTVDSHDLVLAGFSGVDRSLASSAPLLSIGGGETATWSGTVDSDAFGSWAVTCVFRMTNRDSTFRDVMKVETGGTAARWEILINSTSVRLRVVDGSETELHSDDYALGDASYDGWRVLYFVVGNFSPDVSWGLDVTPVKSTATPLSKGALLAGTAFGPPTGVSGSVTTPSDSTFSIGHISVHSGVSNATQSSPGWGDGWLDDAANGHIGETVADRFVRLCEQAGIAGEVVGDSYSDGDPDTDFDAGDPELSEVMGPEQVGTFLELVAACVTLDGGQLIERPAAPGLIYRTRRHIEKQTAVALALDGGTEGVRPGLRFINDDSRLRNEVTVQAVQGSQATARDQTSIDQAGIYDTNPTINGIGGVDLGYAADLAELADVVDLVDTQNTQIAVRLLENATWPGLRCRGIETELSIAETYLPTWHAAQLGDRVSLDGLPEQWTGDIVDLVLVGYQETWTPSRWGIRLHCAPAGPRIGLAAGWSTLDVTATDTQTLPDRAAGAHPATLGSTSSDGDAEDPTVTLGTPPRIDFDGDDDYADAPYQPEFTATAGQLTVVFVGYWSDELTAATTTRLLSFESGDSNGLAIQSGPATIAHPRAQVGSGAAVTASPPGSPSLTDGDLFGVAVVVDDGALYVQLDDGARSSGTDLTGLGTITHATGRIAARADANTANADVGIGSIEVLERVMTPADARARIAQLKERHRNGPDHPTVSLSVTGEDSGFAGSGPATVDNPDQGSGHTLIGIGTGQGDGNEPSPTITAPTGGNQTFDYDAGSGSFVPRIRVWDLPEAGQASETFGFGGSTDGRSFSVLLALDGDPSSIFETATPEVDTAATISFPALTGCTPGTTRVLAVAVNQSSRTRTGGLAGYAIEHDSTGSSQRVVVASAIASAASETPPDITYDSASGAVVTFCIGIDP